MNTRRSPYLQARENYLNAHTIAEKINAALTALDEAQAGWPTSVPGASAPEGSTVVDGWCDELTMIGAIGSACGQPLPCPDHPAPAMSIVERTAFTDKARRELDQLRNELNRAAAPLARAARIVTAWGTPTLNKTTITDRLTTDRHTRRAAIDTGMYCTACSRAGLSNVPELGRTECAFCADIRRDYGVDIRTDKAVAALRELHDTKARRRLYDRDIVRILERNGVKWKRPEKKAG